MNERIVFMGTPSFAVASLDSLLDAGFDIAAVVTAPDRPAGRGLQTRASAVSERAQALGIPVLKPTDLRDPRFLEQLDGTHASLYLVVAFRKLPREVFTRARLGCVNLHASLLPDYRGAAPINWVLINGGTRTGVTTFFIEERIDTGDIILQQAIDIGPDETAGELHDRLMSVGAHLLTTTARQILSGTSTRVPQAMTGVLHAAPKLTTALCQINWNSAAPKVHDHIRGLSPFPGAWSMFTEGDGATQRVKVLRSHVSAARSGGEPGHARMDGDRLLVHCTGGSLEILDLQAEGRRRMSAAEFVRGLRDRSHIRFT